MQITTVPIHYLRFLLDSAERHGLDADQVLSVIGISKELLDHNKARISAGDFNRFTQHIMGQLDDEFCGLLDKPAKVGTFEMMTNACINCPNLQDFIERSSQFNNLFIDDLNTRLTVNQELATYQITPRNPALDTQRFLSFIVMAIVHRLFSWVIGQPLSLQHAGFPHARPQHANEYHYLFRSKIKFEQPFFSITFPASYLQMPNIQNDRTLENVLQNSGMWLMSLDSSDNSMVVKVARLISDDISAELPEFDVVASELCMTTATLRRRLRDEGSSYRQIKDDLRRDTAIHNLGRAGMTIEQVAESVGFSEATSFFRAFKRWTGVTPRAYVQNS
jgi:AraC-like DNA-binding protein